MIDNATKIARSLICGNRPRLSDAKVREILTLRPDTSTLEGRAMHLIAKAENLERLDYWWSLIRRAFEVADTPVPQPIETRYLNRRAALGA